MRILYFNNKTAKTIDQLRKIRGFIIKKIFLSIVTGFIIMMKSGLYTKENIMNKELPNEYAIVEALGYAIIMFVVISIFEYLYIASENVIITAILGIIILWGINYTGNYFQANIETIIQTSILVPIILDILSILLIPILVFYRKKIEGKIKK